MAQSATVDTTVLYAAGNRRATFHEDALEIVKAADRGNLPVLRIPDAVLLETMNGLHRTVGHGKAVDVMKRLQEGDGFGIERGSLAVLTAGIQLFQEIERLSLGDALVVADARHNEVEYLYSFDGDFDGIDGITRLNTPDNPYR
ncbi:MAG: hypothetical protein MAG715_00176 [Methanonatronarchaeales archaeon]|nr:hypothetical protein [Methanonatronarchaeales archaeon]